MRNELHFGDPCFPGLLTPWGDSWLPGAPLPKARGDQCCWVMGELAWGSSIWVASGFQVALELIKLSSKLVLIFSSLDNVLGHLHL